MWLVFQDRNDMAKPTGPEPDKTYTTPISRRKALALGGTGLATALAGCNEVFDPSSGDLSNSPPDSGNGNNENGNEDEKADNFHIVDIYPNSVEFEMYPRRFEPALQNGEEFEYAVQIHSTPLFNESRSLVGETTITVTEWGEQFEINYEFPDELLGYGQQLRLTFQALDHDEEPVEVEIPEGRGDPSKPNLLEEVYLPFYNEAVGEKMVSVRGPASPSDGQFGDEFDSLAQTEVWFNEPEESLYNRPDDDSIQVTEEKYPKNWYGPWTDLQITMVVRYPVYEVMEAEDQNVPLFDWAVFNFDITDIEMIEARRWNSFVVQQIERGHYELADDGQTATTPSGIVRDAHNDEGSLITAAEFYSGDVADTPTPFSEYYRSRYGDAWNSADQSNASPIKFAAGRPVLKRWANEIEESLSNNPNFQKHDSPEYYKATILKAIVGSSPYSFQVGSYTQAPEEVISNWYQNQGDSDALGGNCIDASALFCGIGVHLLDTTVGLLLLDIEKLGHVQACLFGRETPSYLPDQVHNQLAKGPISSSDTREYKFVDDGEYQKYMPVECNYAGATIGYDQRFSRELHGIYVRTFASNIDISSHISLNDEYMPDIDGEVLADREPPQNQLLFQRTVTNPSETPYFENQ